jgi:hypothetical protein
MSGIIRFEKVTGAVKKCNRTYSNCLGVNGTSAKPLESNIDHDLASVRMKIRQTSRILDRFISLFVYVVLCFSLTVSISWADGFSCGDWSNSSLQHKGAISISIDKDMLTWSNGKRSYEATLIKSDTPQLAYSDAASIYMIFGVFSTHDKLYNSGYLRVRRIFFIEEVLKFSELECQVNS